MKKVMRNSIRVKIIFDYLHAARLFDLLDMATNGILEVEILASGDQSCEECRALNGKRYPIMEVIEEMPLPVKECTTWKEDVDFIHEIGWRRSTWVPVGEE